MGLYRVVYTYNTINGDRADIYYTRAENKELAGEKIKQAIPEARIETIRRAIYENQRDKSNKRAVTEPICKKI